jgi:hypothetical protein
LVRILSFNIKSYSKTLSLLLKFVFGLPHTDISWYTEIEVIVLNKVSPMFTTTVCNSIHFHFLYLVSQHVSAYVEAIFRCGFIDTRATGCWTLELIIVLVFKDGSKTLVNANLLLMLVLSVKHLNLSYISTFLSIFLFIVLPKPDQLLRIWPLFSAQSLSLSLSLSLLKDIFFPCSLIYIVLLTWFCIASFQVSSALKACLLSYRQSPRITHIRDNNYRDNKLKTV